MTDDRKEKNEHSLSRFEIAKEEDLVEIKKSLYKSLGNTPADDIRSPSDEKEHLDEIADDMLHIMERIQCLEKEQQRCLKLLEETREIISTSANAVAREISSLRHDLLGDRKGSAHLHAFSILVQRLDQLEQMRSGLDVEQDDRMITQIDALISAISLTIRSLGFLRMQVEPGEPFNPSYMECAGFEINEVEGVSRVLAPGYVSGELIARPMKVVLGRLE